MFCFSGCWFSGLEFTLIWFLDLGNTSLERNLRLKSLGCLHFMPAIFCICCLDAPWITFGYYWGNSLTHLVLTTAFEVSIFGPKVTRRSWVSTPNWVPIWLWSQWYKPLTPTCWKNSPQTCTQISQNVELPLIPKAVIAWDCGGLQACLIPHWIQSLMFKTYS